MWDHEIRAMASTHAIIAASVFMATVLPAVLVPGFSVYGTHLLWLYSVSGAVTAVSVAVFWLLGITPPTKKHTLGYKVLAFIHPPDRVSIKSRKTVDTLNVKNVELQRFLCDNSRLLLLSAAVQVFSFLCVLLPVVPVLPHRRGSLWSSAD